MHIFLQLFDSMQFEQTENCQAFVRDRVEIALVGSPRTHERFLRRARGTYGAVFEDALRDGSTPIEGLTVCGDSVFPGIGVPAVAVTGAAAANAMVGPLEHLRSY